MVFWTSDTGIDGESPVDLDELVLILIDPLPSYVWYQDMVDFAEGISDPPPGAAWAALWTGGERSGASGMNCMNAIRS